MVMQTTGKLTFSFHIGYQVEHGNVWFNFKLNQNQKTKKEEEKEKK
jgi:hypothetical protein